MVWESDEKMGKTTPATFAITGCQLPCCRSSRRHQWLQRRDTSRSATAHQWVRSARSGRKIASAEAQSNQRWVLKTLIRRPIQTSKRHADCRDDGVSLYSTRRAADQCPVGRRIVGAVGIGECTRVVERLIVRPRVNVRHVDEPRRIEEISAAGNQRAAPYPTRSGEILRWSGDYLERMSDVGEAHEILDVRVGP